MIKKKLTISTIIKPVFTHNTIGIDEGYCSVEELQEFLNQIDNRSSIIKIREYSSEIHLDYDSEVDEAYQASLNEKEKVALKKTCKDCGNNGSKQCLDCDVNHNLWKPKDLVSDEKEEKKP